MFVWVRWRVIDTVADRAVRSRGGELREAGRGGNELVGLFAAEVTRRRQTWDEPARIDLEIWRVGPEIYLVNSDPDLDRNVGVCLAVYFCCRGVTVG